MHGNVAGRLPREASHSGISENLSQLRPHLARRRSLLLVCGQPTDSRPLCARLRPEERARRTMSAGVPERRRLRTGAPPLLWVLVIGVVVALLAGLSARFSIGPFPPGLDEKESVTYTAESSILVSSAENPYLRSQKTTFVEQPNQADESTTDEGPATPGARRSRAPTAPRRNRSRSSRALDLNTSSDGEPLPVHHRVRLGRRLPPAAVRQLPGSVRRSAPPRS